LAAHGQFVIKRLIKAYRFVQTVQKNLHTPDSETQNNVITQQSLLRKFVAVNERRTTVGTVETVGKYFFPTIALTAIVLY